MKTFHLILLCFICYVKGYGQTIPPNYYGQLEVEFTKDKRPKKFFASVTNKSAFPDGDSAWIKAVEKNINESIGDGKRVKKGKYMVTVKFILAKDGNLSDIACETDPGFGLCEEVIRVLKKSKKWVPVEQLGKKVREYLKG
ncbi:MAG: hypothetical protein JNK27_11630 [Chitinophagaceae bacterium]|nr:hypothetical protein [Chitinophagaceae bacterium]